MSNVKYFHGINVNLFYKNNYIFEKNGTIVCSEINYSKNSYHIDPSQLKALQINWPVSIWCNFLLKGVSKQTLITTTVIDFRIILALGAIQKWRHQGRGKGTQN